MPGIILLLETHSEDMIICFSLVSPGAKTYVIMQKVSAGACLFLCYL